MMDRRELSRQHRAAMTTKASGWFVVAGALTLFIFCETAECIRIQRRQLGENRDSRSTWTVHQGSSAEEAIPSETHLHETVLLKTVVHKSVNEERSITGNSLKPRPAGEHQELVLPTFGNPESAGGSGIDDEVAAIVLTSGIVIAEDVDIESKDTRRTSQEARRVLQEGSAGALSRQHWRARITAQRRRRTSKPQPLDVAKVMREAWRNVHLASYVGARAGTCRTDLPRIANTRGQDYLTRVVNAQKSGNTSVACANLATATRLTETCRVALEKARENVPAKFLTAGASLMRTTIESLHCKKKTPPKVNNPTPTPTPTSTTSGTRQTTGTPPGEDGDGPTRFPVTFEDAGNPIDSCWFKPGWASDDKSLKSYADCAPGYGGLSNEGGSKGQVYVVTDPSDDPEQPLVAGTLRYATDSEEYKGQPLWIVFDRDMTITLRMEINVPSYFTIDGRGKTIVITSFGFVLKEVSNVILSNLVIRDITFGDSKYNPGGSRGNGIILYSATDVWLDHLSISNCPGKEENGQPTGKLIDVVMGSTRVTISNGHFSNQMFTILLGASDLNADLDLSMRVSLMLNVFEDTVVQRMPRCRFGKFHVLNNYYNKWGYYAVGGSAAPEIRSEGNVYIAPDDKNKKSVTQRFVSETIPSWSANWRSIGDILQNGAVFEQSGDGIFNPPYPFTALPAAQVRSATARAGQSPFRTV